MNQLKATLKQYTIKGSKVGTEEKATTLYDKEEDKNDVQEYIIVDRNGKVKKSSSSRGFAVEDQKFDITDYIATVHEE